MLVTHTDIYPEQRHADAGVWGLASYTDLSPVCAKSDVFRPSPVNSSPSKRRRASIQARYVMTPVAPGTDAEQAPAGA